MKLFAAGEHCDDVFDSLLFGLLFLRGLKPIGDREEVGLVKGFVEGLRFLVLSECL